MFTLSSEDPSGARAGILKTTHGEIPTPCFMPVATRAALRTLDSFDLAETGTGMIIANAFLLSLRPGNDILHESGGIHGFMNWDGALVTDSGGFQMIRKGFLLKLTDQGITLRSPYDGQSIQVTPEDVVQWMGSQQPDVGMVLDDLPTHGVDTGRNRESVDRTIAWFERSKRKYQELELERKGVKLFAILQGGVDRELRKRCINGIISLEPEGYGIGGLSIGESRQEMLSVVDLTTSFLPPGKPIYLMGVGSPLELLDCIAKGVDIFDSVYPARHARHTTVLTGKGWYSIKSATNAAVFEPLEEGCPCQVCQTYTRAYIHHLMRTGEFGWMRLVTIHNLTFIHTLMLEARISIKEHRFMEFRDTFAEHYNRDGPKGNQSNE